MKHFRLFIGSWLVLAFCATAGAFDMNKGVHGMEWGSPISQHDHLTQVREADPVAYYANSDTVYSFADQPVPGVIYGFYKERFFAVYINLPEPNQFYHMIQRFSAEYGDPRVSSNAANEQTVYRWKNEDVKIKLKIKESAGEMKLGIYYAPLSVQLNQEQAEEIPPGTFGPTPAETKKPLESTPLLGF